MLIPTYGRQLKSTKECEHPGCTNLVSAQSNKKYCSDPRCIEDREEKQKEQYNRNRRNARVYPESVNIIIPKKQELSGKTLNIRCSAKSCKHGRCKNIVVVPYTLARRTYPRYCGEHTNEFRRIRWEKGLYESKR